MTLDSKVMDEKSWQLLRELQEDARLTYAELGRRVSLSLPAVAERIHKMEDAGIIEGYRAEINPARIGMPIRAFIRHRSTGGDSFILKVQVRSVQHMESVIDKLTPFGTTSTSVVLSSPVKRRVLGRLAEQVAVRQRRRPSKR